MIRRDVQERLLKDAKKSPVLALLGPRQAGKTTLALAGHFPSIDTFHLKTMICVILLNRILAAS